MLVAVMYLETFSLGHFHSIVILVLPVQPLCSEQEDVRRQTLGEDKKMAQGVRSWARNRRPNDAATANIGIRSSSGNIRCCGKKASKKEGRREGRKEDLRY